MKKSLSTRDALLKIRQFVIDDGDRAVQIKNLGDRLTAAISARANAATEALGVLESYVAHQSEVHGFNSDLENMVAATAKQSKPTKETVVKKAKKAKKATKKVTKKRSTVKTRHAPTNGATFTAPSGVVVENLSPKEFQFVSLLAERGTKFTTSKMLVNKGIIPVPNHVTAKVNQLRKKGVPIESARQARANDDDVSRKARGYRLISG